jgi:hypothetical protein
MLSPIHQKKIAIIMVSHSRYKSREGNKSPPPGRIAADECPLSGRTSDIGGSILL